MKPKASGRPILADLRAPQNLLLFCRKLSLLICARTRLIQLRAHLHHNKFLSEGLNSM